MTGGAGEGGSVGEAGGRGRGGAGEGGSVGEAGGRGRGGAGEAGSVGEGGRVARRAGDRRLEGLVAEFDEHIGLGIVSTPAGGRYGFHCTQIADGSRSIPVGAAVTFTAIAGRGGKWEAGDVRPQPGSTTERGRPAV